MPAADPKTRKHFTFKEEEVNNASAKSKMRTRVDCNHCNTLRALDGYPKCSRYWGRSLVRHACAHWGCWSHIIKLSLKLKFKFKT